MAILHSPKKLLFKSKKYLAVRGRELLFRDSTKRPRTGNMYNSTRWTVKLLNRSTYHNFPSSKAHTRSYISLCRFSIFASAALCCPFVLFQHHHNLKLQLNFIHRLLVCKWLVEGKWKKQTKTHAYTMSRLAHDKD